MFGIIACGALAYTPEQRFVLTTATLLPKLLLHCCVRQSSLTKLLLKHGYRLPGKQYIRPWVKDLLRVVACGWLDDQALPGIFTVHTTMRIFYPQTFASHFSC